MNKQYFTSLGSGSLPHNGYGPVHNLPPGMYPVPHSKSDLRSRVGDGAIVLNPEDFCLSIGLRQQAITIGGTGIALPAVALEYRRALVLHNDGPGVLYIGDINVTTSDGLPLAMGEKIAFDIQGTPNTLIFGISNVICNVRILELS